LFIHLDSTIKITIHNNARTQMELKNKGWYRR
jgi:hypothetical protein